MGSEPICPGAVYTRRMTLRVLVLICAAAAATSGCASFYPVESTPEGITRNIAPGDTVRALTREHGEVTLLVMAVNDYEMRGRVDKDPEDVLRIRFDSIELLEIERLSMKRALLTVVLPVVVGAIVACNNDDCSTRGVVDGRF